MIGQINAQPTVEEIARVVHSTPAAIPDLTAAMLAMLPGRPESVVKAEALREAADEAQRLYAGTDGTFMGSAVGYVKAWLSVRADQIESEAGKQ